MKLGILICIVGIIVALVIPVMGMALSENVVVGEKLCVDGAYNKNLAGIMCEETESSMMGIPMGWMILLTIIFTIIGLKILIIGLNWDAVHGGNE